jgi:hypothetical protein
MIKLRARKVSKLTALELEKQDRIGSCFPTSGRYRKNMYPQLVTHWSILTKNGTMPKNMHHDYTSTVNLDKKPLM